MLCEAEVSLISTGTETYCLRGVFDVGTNWADWVHYPFYPGYSMVARVVSLGPSVQSIRVGDRIAAYVGHCQRFIVPADEVIRVPDSLDVETACWTLLAVTTQLGVRRGRPGDLVQVALESCPDVLAILREEGCRIDGANVSH